MTNWFTRNQKTIGYSVGGLNLVSGILNLVQGNYFLASAVLTTGLSIFVQSYFMEKHND